MTKLICPDCQRENEPERIYCHDCGARLDRTALAKAQLKEEDPKATQRRLQSMFDPHRARIRQRFFQFSKVLLGACATAALVQILLPPDVPPRTKAVGLSSQIGLDLESASMEHRGTSLRYTDEQANAYIASTLKSKQAALSQVMQFERALVHFDQGLCRVTVERSLFGYSLFTSAEYAISISDGKFNVSARGGAIGRLPLHPQLIELGSAMFSDVWAALERERKSLSKMAAVEFQPETVLITGK